MSDVMRHASVHSCFHVALAGSGLEVDPLTASVHSLASSLDKQGFNQGEQLKAAASTAFTTSVDVALDLAKRMKQTGDLAAAIRARSMQLHHSGYKC